MTPLDEASNPRKARRDRRRVPKASLDGRTAADVPIDEAWRRTVTSSAIGRGREICIASQAHDLARTFHFRATIRRCNGPDRLVDEWWVHCRRCGAFAGVVKAEREP